MNLSKFLALGLLTAASSMAVMAQTAVVKIVPFKSMVTTLPLGHRAPIALPSTEAGTVIPMPSWHYSVTAGADLGGGTYTGTMLGTNPFDAVPTASTIKVQIVPLVITIDDGTTVQVYDPTAPDACNSGKSAVNEVLESPIFTSNRWTMNRAKVGNTQYIDANQRAQFWSVVAGTNYHVRLRATVLAGQAQAYTGAANGLNLDASAYGGCGHIGVINIYDMDARLNALITGPLKRLVNAGTFPIFVTKDVVQSVSGVDLSQCCVLGYHGATQVGSNVQIYSPFAFDTSGLFGGDVETLSHEMGEAINDPYGDNATPVWGNIGQVLGGCQNNFENGDPLSEGYGTPTKAFTVVGANGSTYHMQELAFMSWFYGNGNTGAGGKYSNNGSFTGNAKLCSAGGGTN